MSKKFLSLVTKQGTEAIAAAIVNDERVAFAEMAVGDGNGIVPVPDENQTALINELFRTQLNSVKIVDDEKNIIAVEMIMPPEVGGFTIREAALFDAGGVCLAVASVPETYKPLLAEGSGRFTVLRIWLTVSSTANIELIVDPGIVLATVEDVIQVGNDAKDYTDNQLSEHAQSRNHPDATLTEKGFTKLSNDTDSEEADRAATPAAVKAAIAQAIRAAWELDNPVGTTRFFNQNVNPNEQWSWSEWVYTGENKTIRVGKADGSNVGQTGGSDSVSIQKANLPDVQIDVSGEISDHPEQILRTGRAGRHKHGGVPSRENPWEIGGDISQQFNPANQGETDEVDDHDHEVIIPVQTHTFSGKTRSLGSGAALGVVESHTLLMCWSRVA
ncbi:phage tail protein [Klebsiella aerogenes]|uniref:phage tail protein n=1 Tax=Klebsiella aerogenes TaxID=548 RepID=UPI002B2753AF|nr:phage tail protein [Klebsiella aerogenes]MEA8784038.1 phage tail protein [Klebsiella aerogenes]